MGKKKEKSDEIMRMIEEFNHEFGESYSFIDSFQCVHGPTGFCVITNQNEKFTTENLYDEDNIDLYTFAIIKPNSVQNRDSAKIMEDIQKAGLKVLRANLKAFTKEESEEFYIEHKGKFFCDELVEFMTSGSVITLVLKKNKEIEGSAIKILRDLMGPVEAIEKKDEYAGTLRAKYAKNMTENSIHGSDSVESFKREVSFF